MIIIDTASPSGNAFAIMAIVRKALREMNLSHQWEETQTRMMSGDYENLKEIATKVTNGGIKII